MQSAAADFKYALGACLHEGDREAEYRTQYEGQPAIVKFIRPETSLEQAKVLSDFAHAARLPEPGARRVVDFGEAHIFDTDVIFAVTVDAPAVASAPPVPLYRKHAKLAIGGAIGTGILSLLLLRNAEHKAPAALPAPVVVTQQAPLVAEPALTPKPAVKSTAHRKPRRKHR